MSRHSKNFGTLFWEEIFGSPKKNLQQRDYELEHWERQAKRRFKRQQDKARRFAKRLGVRHP